VHKDFLNTGRIPPELGTFYDEAFDDRHEADYGHFVKFDSAVVRTRIEMAERFVAEMRRLLGR
jgi:uncharacterized protein (UPF0332 family)